MPIQNSVNRASIACWLLVVFAASFLCGQTRRVSPLGPEEYSKEWLSRVVSSLDEMTPGLMEQFQVPGVSIAVVSNGHVAWSRQFGVVRADADAKVGSKTLFEACSMSKPLFAYGVLQLAQQGKIDLDKPLVDYLGRTYVEDDERHRRITARMVLCHTTGFPNWRKGQLKNPKPPAPKYEPGSRFTYSGEGYTFLQLVIEKLTHQRLDQFMRQAILDPIGMKSSSYRWNKVTERRAAAGHDSTGKVKTARPRFKRPNAAYTLFTSPEEYGLFLIEMMRTDRTDSHSLSRSTLADMLKRQTPGKKPKHWYGLGWAIQESPRGDEYYHGGANGTGFRCFCWYNRERQIGIVVMTNGIGGAKLHSKLMQSIGMVE